MRRVLVLHGFSQNGNIFSKRLGALRKECSKEVELVFVDAPHILQPVDLASFTTPLLQVSEATGDLYTDPNLTPRGWWKSDAARTKATGLMESLETIRQVFQQQGRFDGVLGFSQGAALAVLLSALLERPESYPPFLVDGRSPHPPFLFCIAVSGFKIGDPLANTVFEKPYRTPTLIINGKNDVIVTAERSAQLLQLATSYRLEIHDGGHFVPSKASWRKFLRDYMIDSAADIPSPH